MRVTVSPPPPPAPLLGSRAQVRWAERIRGAALAEAATLRDLAAWRLRRGQVAEADVGRVRVVIEAADSLARDCCEAGWWIDRRGHCTESLLVERGRAIRCASEATER